MRLTTYSYRGAARAGAALDDWMIDLERTYTALHAPDGDPSSVRRAAQVVPADLVELLTGGPESLRAARDAVEFATRHLPADGPLWIEDGLALPIDDIRYLPPIPRPGKVICLGLNYADHADEASLDLPPAPELFAKFSNALIGHHQPIVLPTVSEQVDYEAELAVVMGRRARAVSQDEALDYVAGYTILNDVSVRDYQARTTQWLPGKAVDGTTPVGPWIVTTDEIPDPQTLDISLDIDGEVLQSAHTSAMLFDVRWAIEFISSVITLDPGDVISTGTPYGVGLFRDPQRWLRPGEVVTVSVKGIGSLSNRIAAAADADRHNPWSIP